MRRGTRRQQSKCGTYRLRRAQANVSGISHASDTSRSYLSGHGNHSCPSRHA
ncbi:hypothetical protein SAMN05446635_1674 [Burkholderia sp. OK233]|nr:hypothetical protein SAMN05446635_1674 [Burkholderia sp. OK233]